MSYISLQTAHLQERNLESHFTKVFQSRGERSAFLLEEIFIKPIRFERSGAKRVFLLYFLVGSLLTDSQISERSEFSNYFEVMVD